MNQREIAEWKRRVKADQARQRAKALRYKRPALATLGWHDIYNELCDIQNACEDIRWIEDSSDITQEVLSGDEDEGCGYQMDFSQLAGDAERLASALYDACGEMYGDENTGFDDCLVGLLGNRFDCVGYDTIETDYFALCSYDAGLAQRESAKRLMRMTKAEMLTAIGQNLGILLAFYDLRQRYDYAKAALATATEHNLDTLRTVREIDEAYAAWCADDCPQYGDKLHRLERAADDLPEIFWIA